MSTGNKQFAQFGQTRNPSAMSGRGEPAGIHPVGRVLAFMYTVAIVAICCVGLVPRLQLPAWPFLYPDSWGYFGPAIHWLVDQKVQHISARSLIPYPLLMTVLLGVFKDFRVIPLFQHGVAIVSALFIGLAFFRLAGVVRSALVQALVLIIAMPVLVLFLFADESIVYEHSINPEGFAQLFIALNIVLLVECLRSCRYCRTTHDGFSRPVAADAEDRYFRRMGSLLVLNSILLYFTRPQWGVSLFVPPAAVLLLSTPKLGELSIGRLFTWLRPLLQGGIVGLVFVAIPEEIAFNKTDYNNLIERPGTMFAFHADVSMLQVGAERDGTYPTNYSKQELDTAFASWEEELQLSKTVGTNFCRYHDFDPNRLYYASDKFKEIYTVFHQDISRIRGFYLHNYVMGIIRYPGVFIESVYRQLRMALEPNGYYYAPGRDFLVDDYRRDTLRVISFLPELARYAPGRELPEIINADQATVGQVYRNVLNPYIREPFRKMPPYFIPEFVIVLGLLLVTTFLHRCGLRPYVVRAADALFPVGIASVFLFICSLVANTSVAAVHSLCIGRYLDFHQIDGIAAQALGIVYLVGFALVPLSGIARLVIRR